jgi:sugar phosphate isomerase/epimerase
MRSSHKVVFSAGSCLAALLWAVICSVAAAEEPKPAAKATCLTNPLAIRIMNYGKFQDDAWTHLPSLGMHYIFMSAPMPNDVDAVTKLLAEHHLRPLVFRGYTNPGRPSAIEGGFFRDGERGMDLGEPSSVDALASRLAVCEQMGVKYMFLAPKHTGLSKEAACDKLRRVGEIAKKHGVTVVLETHPDLGVNAANHLETMRRVNHPNVRVNFDTGNITFYNQGTDAVTELKKIIDYVATVELKDHTGQYKVWNFPALGQGVVDFPAVLKVLEEHHFTGPITMEVEGVKGVQMDEAQTKRYIADSVKYIQSLGNFR